MTPEQYEESLRRLRLEVYMFGKRVPNPVDDPIIRPSMKAMAKAYELAHYPEYEHIMTARSHLSGQLVEFFAAYHRQSYACKVGVSDVLIDVSRLISEYNRTTSASHVKDKLIG